MPWIIGEPPQSVKNRSLSKQVKLRYKDEEGRVSTRGIFFWDKTENSWSECCEGPDGIALYESDGWKVVAWFKNEPLAAKDIKDIIVTTPRNMMAVAEKEAQQCIKAKKGFYFRTFRNVPKNLGVGSRIFYVEDGYVRGFGLVSKLKDGNMTCGTTGEDWGEGTHAMMSADSWKWIKPIPMKGFQGWRYFDASKIKVVGNWLKPKPAVNRLQTVH